MTWLNSDYWLIPTIDKSGYPGILSRSFSQIDKVIYHSAEGWQSNIMNIQNDPARRASWPETVLLDGTRWAHYQVEKVTWTSGTVEANITGYAVEFEGVKGTPITDKQVEAAAEIYRDLLELGCPLKAPVLGQGFEEHRRVSGGATTCPNDRIRWNDIAALLNEEDTMTPEQEAKLDLVLAVLGWGTFYAGDPESTDYANAANLPGWFRRHLDLTLTGGQAALTNADYDAISDRVVDKLALRLKD